MQRTSPVRIGIIGLGAIGERLIGTFGKNSDVKVTAVCDTRVERAQQVAVQLGGISWHTDHHDLLAQSDVDLVYVAVPPKFHHDIVLDVLAAGKNILCEKPLANSVEEAASMLSAAQKAGVLTAMNFPLNYEAALNRFEELYQQGYIGKLERLELVMHFPQWPRAWQQNPWIGGREQGGFVLEVGVHFIQMMHRLFGPITRVQSALQFPDDPQACENAIEAQAELADGTPLHIDGQSQWQGDEHISLTAYGDQGQLALINWGRLEGAQHGEAVTSLSTEGIQVTSLTENLVKALTGQPAAIYDFEVGYNAQVVLEALRHPAQQGWVDLTEQLIVGKR